MDETDDSTPSWLKGLLNTATTIYGTVSATELARQNANRAADAPARKSTVAVNWKPWLIGGTVLASLGLLILLMRRN